MKFENRSDGYYRIDGELYPSVTTILKVLNKPALFRWALYQGAEIQKTKNPKDNKELWKLFQEASQKNMDRGSQLHDLAETYFKSGTFIQPLEPIPFYDAFKKFVEKFNPKPVHVEVQVHSKKHGYAGTCDGVFEINGQLAVVDWKTGKGLYDEVELQLSAYAHALKEMGMIKKWDTLMAVCFKPTGDFEYQQYIDKFDVFASVKQVWEWNK